MNSYVNLILDELQGNTPREKFEYLKKLKSKPTRQKKTNKEHETELYVDKYILDNGYPPTYEDITNHFNLKSRTAAYARCKKFRFKLVNRIA